MDNKPKLKTLLLITAMVFLLKLVEITVESVRLLLYINGHVTIASLLATMDVALALWALKYIVENLRRWPVYVAYCAGYGAGTWLGSVIYASLSKGI